MKIKIISGRGWYEEHVGQEFDVYEISDCGSTFSPEKAYHIDPPNDGQWTRYISEFDCKTIKE